MFQIYAEVIEETETKINALYKKYEDENGLNASQARKYLKGEEYSVWQRSMAEYLDEIKGAGANSELALELNTLAMKSRISREEKILSELYREMYDMANMQQGMMYECLEEVLQVTYARNSKNFATGSAKFSVYKLNQELVKQVLEYPWGERHFSKSIWDNVDSLCENTRRILAKGFTSGASVQKMTSELVKAMDVGRLEADRLIRTECRIFANRGEVLSYLENGVDRYIFKNGKSENICGRCTPYNNVAMLIDKIEPFKNFPPIHPFCRCYIVPYFEDSMFGNDGVVKFEDLSKEPKLLEVLDDVSEKNVLSRLKYYESVIKDDIIENAIVITKTGEVYRCFGTEYSVNPMLLGDKLLGASVTHNHPSKSTEYTFSKYDLSVFLNSKLKVLRGIDDKYSYEINRTGIVDVEVFNVHNMPDDYFEHQYFSVSAKERGVGYWRKAKDE